MSGKIDTEREAVIELRRLAVVAYALALDIAYALQDIGHDGSGQFPRIMDGAKESASNTGRLLDDAAQQIGNHWRHTMGRR